MSNEFKVGDVVARYYGGAWSPTPTKRTVSKVYKNGNFFLEDDDQQYRVNGWATGSGRSYVQHWTKDQDEQIDEQERKARAGKLNKSLSYNCRHLSLDAIVKIEKLLIAEGFEI